MGPEGDLGQLVSREERDNRDGSGLQPFQFVNLIDLGLRSKTRATPGWYSSRRWR
jgi:hypothetical protein